MWFIPNVGASVLGTKKNSKAFTCTPSGHRSGQANNLGFLTSGATLQCEKPNVLTGQCYAAEYSMPRRILNEHHVLDF